MPVIGVPIPTQHLGGMDSLLSIVQMPRGIPVATVAIGNAINAGLRRADPRARRPRARCATGGWRARQTPEGVLDDPSNADAIAVVRRLATVPDAGEDPAVLGQVEADVEHGLEDDEDGHGRLGRAGHGDGHPPTMIVTWRTTRRPYGANIWPAADTRRYSPARRKLM